MLKIAILSLLIATSYFSHAQYAPAVGQTGSTAIYKDSSIIIAWASQASISRGWQNISNQSLGKTTVGDQNSVIGKADNDVVSLGDGGEAIIQFTTPISNGLGPDFAVFENAFDDLFLELAFVEVSSDGQHYYRFPAHSLTQANSQIGGFGQLQTTKINNLAGKYKVAYGTPFDLDELKNIAGLNVNQITHIKIIDVVGSIDDAYATHDTANNKINDPFPTPFPSGGFDLDAIGLMHLVSNIDNIREQKTIKLYPNPTDNQLNIMTSEKGIFELLSFEGKLILRKEIGKGISIVDLQSFAKGVYLAKITLHGKIIVRQILKN